MSLSEMDQLYRAKKLAMENSPDQMLPKVLETSASLYISEGTTPQLKLELARFTTRLLLDVITHESIGSSQKPFIASQHLNCLWSVCRNVKDSIAYKYSVLAFSASYPLLFELVAKTSDQEMWDTMQQMKAFIVSNWNTTYPLQLSSDDNDPFLNDRRNIGPRLATAKFLSEIVIVHTSSNGSMKASPIGISSVPDGHPVISNKQQLESEAKKFLDILLNYLIEEPMMVSSVFIGILNCLAFIMKQRSQATVRILSGLLKFNVDAKYQADDIPVLNYRLGKRFVERCYKNFVQFGLKSQLIKNSGQMASQHMKLSKISQTLHVIGEETKSKGIMNFDAEQMENKMSQKDKQKYASLRRRQIASKNGQSTAPSIASPVVGTQSSTPQPASTPNDVSSTDKTSTNVTQLLTDLQRYTMSKNNIAIFFNNSPIAIDNSYGSIYSLMNSKNSEQDMSKLPQDMMIKLCSEAFYNTDTTKMISGLSIVASRYTDLMNKVVQQQQSQPSGKKRKADQEEEADNLAKKVKKEEDSEPQTVSGENEEDEGEEDDYYDGIKDQNNNEVDIIKPVPMTEDEKKKHLQRIIQHIMSSKDSDETTGISASMGQNQSPLERVKLMNWNNKDSWLHILTRLCIRGVSHQEKMSEMIRQTLYDYFIEEFNGRIGMALEWLGEEWYYASLTEDQPADYKDYDEWSLKFLEGLVPFLENQHRRIFIRLMSELPRIEQQHIDKVRPICLDPARSSLGFQTLKFLVMFRPPVKPMVRKLLEQIKAEDPTTEGQCDAILNKFYQ